MRLSARLRRDLAAPTEGPAVPHETTEQENPARENAESEATAGRAETGAPQWVDRLAGEAPQHRAAADPEAQPIIEQLRRELTHIDRRYRLITRRARHEGERRRPALGTKDTYIVPAGSDERRADRLTRTAREAPRRRLAARSFPSPDDPESAPRAQEETPGRELPWSPNDASAAKPLRQTADEAGLLYRATYKAGEALGALQLGPPEGSALEQLRALLPLGAPEALAPADLLFIDTETTGLSRGAGTMAFMIGVGLYSPDHGGLEIAQIVVDAPERESEALELLATYLARARALVSFNGASFDLPVLRNRAVLCRAQETLRALDELPHIDLLPPCRRLFRGRLPDCRLGTIERGILGFRRVEDIPGAEAPLAYLRFLRSGRREELQEVLEHNLLDVAALAALLPRVAGHVADPLHWAEDAPELLASARYHHKSAPDLSIACLERALEMTRRPGERRQILSQLAQLHRRCGRRQVAAEHWQALRDEFPQHDEGYIELAKHHEHITKELSTALEHAEAAPHAARPEIQHRLSRLRRRLASDVPNAGRPREAP